jgi:hypothetical protein
MVAVLRFATDFTLAIMGGSVNWGSDVRLGVRLEIPVPSLVFQVGPPAGFRRLSTWFWGSWGRLEVKPTCDLRLADVSSIYHTVTHSFTIMMMKKSGA